MKWTNEQELIFEDVPKSSHHVIINAVAGSGKTSTMVELGNRFNNGCKFGRELKVCFLAFMKSGVKAIDDKSGGQFKVSTMHSEGFRLLRMYWKGLSFLDRDRKYIAKWLSNIEDEQDRGLIESVGNVVSIIKHEFVDLDDIDRGMLLNSMIRSTSLTVPSGGKWSEREVAEMAIKFAKWWLDNFGSDVTGLCCTYDDMVWIPVASEGIEADRYDVLIVDEVQDLNPVQQELIKGLGRRIVAVGDDKQAIMGFSGACNEGMNILGDWMAGSERGVERYELSYTFRCPKRVTDQAKKYNNMIRSYRNDQGVVKEISESDVIGLIRQSGRGERIMILCRNNKPLMELGVRMICEGVEVEVNDRGLVKGVIKVLKRNDQCDIERKIEYYRFKHDKNSNDGRIRYVLDLLVISKVIVDYMGGEIDKAIVKLAEMIKSKRGESVKLSTVHKAKGLEADRVFLWKPELIKVGSGQEDNLAYVAITRAANELYLVGKIGNVNDKEVRIIERSS